MGQNLYGKESTNKAKPNEVSSGTLDVNNRSFNRRVGGFLRRI